MPPRLQGQWINTAAINPREYQCGYCGRLVASDKGYLAVRPGGAVTGTIHACPNCNRPSFFEEYRQIPASPFGNPVASLPAEVEALYDEARRCTAADAPTSVVMAVRKLLMHIAVNKGAREGKNFLEYVDYLAAQGFVPPGGRDWVDHIREKGNEANHEIKLMSPDDAKELINFAEMLLKFIYEFPARVPAKKPAP